MKGSGAPKSGTITPTPASKPSGGTQAPTVVAEVTSNESTPIASPKLLESNTQPVNKPLVQPKSEPKLSGADKFRWPVSGRVITDFGNSKGTGINIEAPEGASIRAAENGQVIYVGSGVEGYGNLILIRHPNGYVSAYAHLKEMSVGKGDVVNRGDNIGSAGMTGGVSRPQLHFELRKGATPVDPVPLLAS
jgi:murein DD-endopeptidase MepM/ murein hydrolase activator NlpD